MLLKSYITGFLLEMKLCREREPMALKVIIESLFFYSYTRLLLCCDWVGSTAVLLSLLHIYMIKTTKHSAVKEAFTPYLSRSSLNNEQGKPLALSLCDLTV